MKCDGAGAHNGQHWQLLHNCPTPIDWSLCSSGGCQTRGRRRAENLADGNQYFVSPTVRRVKSPIRVVDNHQSAEKVPIDVGDWRRAVSVWAGLLWA